MIELDLIYNGENFGCCLGKNSSDQKNKEINVINDIALPYFQAKCSWDDEKNECLREMPELAYYPINLVKALGGYKKILSLPVLKLQELDDGREYIDYIEEKHLQGDQISRGETRDKRQFITFVYCIRNVAKKCLKREVRTIFQRHPNELNWTHGGKRTRFLNYFGDDYNADLIAELFEKKCVCVNKKYVLLLDCCLSVVNLVDSQHTSYIP